MSSDNRQRTRGPVPSGTKRASSKPRETGLASIWLGSVFVRCLRAFPWSLLVSSALALSACDLVQPFQGLVREPYALDELSRTVTADESLQCDRESLVRYEGELVTFEPALSVARPFVERLKRLERAVVEKGRDHYGRAPSKILNAGAFACRRVGHRPERLSEHALGNAVDITGFRFPPLAESQGDVQEDGLPTQRTSSSGSSASRASTPGQPEAPSASRVPEQLKAEFVVTVRDDWQAGPGVKKVAQVHQLFFRSLAQVIREKDMFRSAIGPPEPKHETHLHLDMAPWGTMRL